MFGNGNGIEDEFLIPTLIRKSINDKAYTCNIINTDAKWCGVTYKEDKEQLIEFLNKLYDEGVYPKDMWKQDYINPIFNLLYN